MTFVGLPLEPPCVDLVVLGNQDVAGTAPDQARRGFAGATIRFEASPEPRHDAVQAGVRAGRRTVGPERLDQLIGGADLTGAQKQECQQCPLQSLTQ